MVLSLPRVFFFLIFVFSLAFSFAPLPAEAAFVPCGRSQDDPNTPQYDESARCTICHLVLGGQGIVNWGLKVMTYFAIAVLVAMAILYIVSAGNEGLMSTAKSGIFAALIGFGVMLGAWLIVNTILSILADQGPGKPLSGLQSNGVFSFTCSLVSSSGSTSGRTDNPLGPGGAGTGTGTGTGTGGGASCTDPAGEKTRLTSGGVVCNQTCRKTKCNFSQEVLDAIQNNSGTIDPKILKAIACQESTGNVRAVNRRGNVLSCGLMQVNAPSGSQSCPEDLFNPVTSVQRGVALLNQKMSATSSAASRYSGVGITNLQTALAAYNCCGNGEDPNAQSNSCQTAVGTAPDQGWPAVPKWACPIAPGSDPVSNMCGVKNYACDITACAAQY